MRVAMKIIILIHVLSLISNGLCMNAVKRNRRQGSYYGYPNNQFFGDTQQLLQSPFSENILNVPPPAPPSIPTSQVYAMPEDKNPISWDMKQKYNGNLDNVKTERDNQPAATPFLGRKSLSGMPNLSKTLANNLSNQTVFDYKTIAEAFTENMKKMETLAGSNLSDFTGQALTQCIECPDIKIQNCDKQLNCCECKLIYNQFNKQPIKKSFLQEYWWIGLVIIIGIIIAIVFCICCIIRSKLKLAKCLLKAFCCCCCKSKHKSKSKHKKSNGSSENTNLNNNNNNNNDCINACEKQTADDETSNDEDAMIDNDFPPPPNEPTRNKIDLKEKIKEIKHLLNKIVNDELKSISLNTNFNDKDKSDFVNEAQSATENEVITNTVNTIDHDIKQALKGLDSLEKYLPSEKDHQEIVNIKFKNDSMQNTLAEQMNLQEEREKNTPMKLFRAPEEAVNHENDRKKLVKELIVLQNEKMQKKVEFGKIKKLYENENTN